MRKLELKVSSNIADAHYDEEAKILKVGFKNGGIYTYHDVPSSIAENFENSASAGKYLSSTLVGKYHTKKVK